MKKALAVFAAAIIVALAQAAAVNADNDATVTHERLPSSIADATTVYPMTCDETQVVNDNQRMETFQCTFDDTAPQGPIVCDSSFGCQWFSDFDGAEATSTHFVITPSGLVLGWAIY